MKRYIIFSITFFIVGIITSGIVNSIHDLLREERGNYNKCVRVLINEDYIEEGCDKYFLNDKWYNNYMEQMFLEYKELNK